MDLLFDYATLHLLTGLFALLKFLAFITWPWWVVAIPSLIALFFYIMTFIYENR